MATPTDPSVLANDARCFDCLIPPGYQFAVQTYLLAVLAGVPTDEDGVQNLVNQARCFQCVIPPGAELAVQNYLLSLLIP